MSKVLKVAAIVVAVAAIVVATGGAAAVGIGTAGAAASAGGLTAGAIATASVTAATAATAATVGGISAATLSMVAGGLSIAANLTASRPTAGGIATQFKADPNASIPYAIGRTFNAGNIIYRRTHNTTGYSLPDLQTNVVILSGAGPIDAVESFTADKAIVSFSGGSASGGFATWMFQNTQLGQSPEAGALSTAGLFVSSGKTTSAAPGWGSSNKLSGFAAAMWTLRYDLKSKIYSQGAPIPGWVVRGVRVYDPRLDSTYPGGSGSCRSANEATFVYSENPYLHALTFALGRYQNGQRILGVGAPIVGIDVAAFVDGANVADANNWKVGGVIYSGDGKWGVLKAILQAGSGEPMHLGAKLSCIVNAPKVTLATVTLNDVIGEASVTGTQPRRDRINRIIPRYRSEAHGWQVIPALPIVVAAHVSTDGGLRTKEVQYPLVQDLTQVSQLARYDIENAREFGPIALPLKLRWMGYKPGDQIAVNLPEVGLNGQTVVIVNRELDAEGASVTLIARSETAAKHAFALGQTGVAPPTPSVTAPPTAPTPGVSDWAISATSLTAGGSVTPALVATGAAVNPIDAIVFEYRLYVLGQASEAGWITSGEALASATRWEATALLPVTAYEVAVSYVLYGVTGPRRILGPVTTSANTAAGISGQAATATSSDFAAVTGATKPANNATVGANASNFTGSVGGGNLLYNAGFTRRSSLRPVAYSVYNGGEIATEWVNIDGRNGGSAFGLRALAATSNTTFGLLAGDFTPEPTISGVIGGWKPNTTYMLSFWAKKLGAFVNPGMLLGWNIFPASVVEVANPAVDASGFKRFVFRINWGASVEPNGHVFISWKPEAGTGRVAVNGDIFILDDLQVEEGDVATSWSLGPPLADDVIYADGTRVEALKPATAGADVTAANTAAAIAGQGVLATRNRVTLGAAEGGLTNQANDTWLLDASIITGIGTAAGITGQAATATNSNYTAITGTKPPADADKTSANTAAAIAGQGALATQNTVDWATGVTGKPAGFGEVTVGVGETIKKYMAAYATATFSGGYGATASTATNGNRNARLLANGSVFATGDAWFAGPGEPGSGEVAGTFTNGATAQLVSFSVGYSGSAVVNDTTKIFCRG